MLCANVPEHVCMSSVVVATRHTSVGCRRPAHQLTSFPLWFIMLHATGLFWPITAQQQGRCDANENIFSIKTDEQWRNKTASAVMHWRIHKDTYKHGLVATVPDIMRESIDKTRRVLVSDELDVKRWSIWEQRWIDILLSFLPPSLGVTHTLCADISMKQ